MHEAQPSNLVLRRRHVIPREVTPRRKTDVCPVHVHVRGRPFGRGPFAVVAFAAGRPETCRCRLLAAASGTVFADPRGNGQAADALFMTSYLTCRDAVSGGQPAEKGRLPYRSPKAAFYRSATTTTREKRCARKGRESAAYKPNESASLPPSPHADPVQSLGKKKLFLFRMSVTCRPREGPSGNEPTAD
ncbi:hypothetical protein HPB47_021098 [Ixodes persulcatus]|uniref:Uncharacterized protein n=1 Tax=Ixodes persulcatus TaxID=34615 RepID=A0AC60QFZ9_IXOPE|nr:hypothetical protein HPB47_021098 [Ixodes persulcatus]